MSGKKKRHPDDYEFTIEEAALYLSVSIQTIRRKVWQGKIPYKKPFNRILLKKRDLDKYLQAS